MLENFIKPNTRQLPIIILLDVSGSMYGEKINYLNSTVREMLTSFSNEEAARTEINVTIITFGASTKIHADLKPAKGITWSDMETDDMTSLGEALEEAKQLVEDRNKIPSKSYRPIVILVSDGELTGNWEDSLEKFISNGRSAKCDRWAVGIGENSNLDILNKFINDEEKKVFKVEDSSEIKKFFRFITMSTTYCRKTDKPHDISEELKQYDNFSSEDIYF